MSLRSYSRLYVQTIFEIILTVGISIIFYSDALANKFDTVFEWIDRGRESGHVELKIQIEPDSLIFLGGAHMNVASQDRASNFLNEGIPESLLKMGAEGNTEDFLILKHKLLELGYKFTRPDNMHFDSAVKEAIQDFQSLQGVAVDGIVGPDTWTRIFLESRAKQLPIQKIQRLDIHRIVLQMNVNSHHGPAILEKRIGGSQPSEWILKWDQIIEAYPAESWKDFIRLALGHGLVAFHQIQAEPEPLLFLTFQSQGLKKISADVGPLTFSNAFYKHMRISPLFAPSLIQDGKIVLFIHDPHSNLEGLFQLIWGLKELHDVNQQLRFKYLVEGFHIDETRDVPVSPLLQILTDEVSREAQVFGLARKFLVDGPLAYRLLYGNDIPALAIDDPELITKSPLIDLDDRREEELAYIQSFYNSFARHESEALTKKVQESEGLTMPDFLEWKAQFLSQEGQILDDAQEVHDALTLLAGLLDLDYVDSGVQRNTSPGYWGQLETAYKTIAESKYLKNFSSHIKTEKKDNGVDNLFSKDRKFFSETAYKYNQRISAYGYASRRSDKMASKIIEHFEGPDKERIPVVFIGNFHTKRLIVNMLRSSLSMKPGFIVLEPRVNLFTETESGKENFRKSINSAERSEYLEQALGMLKGPVSPKPEELQQYRALIKAQVSTLKSQKEQFLKTSPLDLILTNQLWSVLEHHPQFKDANIRFEDQARAPPEYKNAFVSVSNKKERGIEELVFYKDEIKKLKVEDFEALGRTLFFPPQKNLANEIKRVNIRIHGSTLHTTVWTGGVFYVLRDETNLVEAMTIPQTQSTTIHSLFSEIVRMFKEKRT